MKTKHCFLGMIILGALAPGVGWGQTTVTDSANSMKLGAQHDSANGGNPRAQHRNDQGEQHDATASRRHKGVAAPTPAQNRASRPSHKARDRAVASERSSGTNKALAAAGLTPSQHVVALPGFSPNAAGPTTVAVASGNAVARHSPVKAGAGGPITYDAKHNALVIIGGTAMGRSRPPRFGDPQ